MRHYYDSLRFPFLTDLLFDQLLNFDWKSTRKELDEERKKMNERERKMFRTDSCIPSVTCADDWSKDVKFYSPQFELGEDGVYTYKTTVPKEVKPGDLKIDAYPGHFYFGYNVDTENGSYSTASTETLPDDLDIDSMKAVLKNGVVTITAKQVVKDEPEDDETEYEIEIGK